MMQSRLILIAPVALLCAVSVSACYDGHSDSKKGDSATNSPKDTQGMSGIISKLVKALRLKLEKALPSLDKSCRELVLLEVLRVKGSEDNTVLLMSFVTRSDCPAHCDSGELQIAKRLTLRVQHLRTPYSRKSIVVMSRVDSAKGVLISRQRLMMFTKNKGWIPVARPKGTEPR